MSNDNLPNLDDAKNNQTAIWTTSLFRLGKSATTGNGVSGFRATVIHPLDPSAISEHVFSMSQRHVNDEVGQLQLETDSPQSVQGESTPSTSGEHVGLESHESGACEVNAHVNTPRKIFLKIFPVPETPQGRDSKRKDSTTVLKSKDRLAKKSHKFIRKKKSENTRKLVGRFCKTKSRKHEPESKN
jgi:hypothetical protein